jgi:hypothetical protein
MNKSFLLAAAGLVAALALPAAAKPGNGHGGPPDPKPTPVAKGRPGQAKLPMANPVEGDLAKGVVDVKRFPAVGKREQREWLRFKVQHLTPGATYELWMDNPLTGVDVTPDDGVDDAFVLESVATFVPNDDGTFVLRYDTHKGGLLPFGTPTPTTLADFAGDAFEIRTLVDTTPDVLDDPDNTVLQAVLTGTVPTIPEKKK